jgi:hypothetical protein
MIVPTEWAKSRLEKNRTKRGKGVKELAWKAPNCPSINIQNVPGDMGIRELIIFDGVCVWGDYSGLEMGGTGQRCYDEVGHSKILELLNDGDSPIDLHSWVAAHLTSYLFPKSPVTYEEFLALKKKGNKKANTIRKVTKILNLGKPGLLGMYTITDQIIGAGLHKMMGVEVDTDRKYKSFAFFVAKLLTWWDTTFPEFPESLKILREKGKIEGAKKPFNYQYESNGRVRWGCGINAAANGFFMQSKAADGMKHACWLVEKACTDRRLKSVLFGCKLLIAFHDEIVLDCPRSKNYIAVAEELSRLMIVGMNEKSLPDCRLAIEWMISDVWSKNLKKYPPLYTGDYWL